MDPAGDRRQRVLVVDDEPSNLVIVSSLLGDAYRVTVAKSGRRAIELVESSRPDLVLLDVEMPDLDGYATCKLILQRPGCESLPILFLTARSDDQDEAWGFACGAVDYIHKPVSPPVLLARVQTHLALRRALEEAKAQRQRADAMLRVVLPETIAQELVHSGTVAPRRIEEAVVLFADVVGFTSWCGEHPPEHVVARLHNLFTEFEEIARTHNLDKLKTIGDAFMGGCGLLAPHPDPVLASIRCGLEFVKAARRHDSTWNIRVGVHQGPVVAGIVGGVRFQFDVWGDTVNLAARVAGAAVPGTVCVAAHTHAQVAGRVQVVSQGLRSLKGKGDVHLYDIAAVL